MAELKTKVHDGSVTDFIENFVDTELKKKDSYELVKLFENWTGYPAKMWGTSIIGFGKYHYKSSRSKQEGDWPLVGFSPRKNAISFYVYVGSPNQDELLKDFGKFTMGKGCIYVKKLSDINLDILKQLVLEAITELKKKYEIAGDN